jgi:hypothetical protein
MRGMISQSNFFPWRGYYASLRKIELMVFYDSQQFTRRDWRNRNILYRELEPFWLSLPVKTKNEYLTPINQIRVLDSSSMEGVRQTFNDAYRNFSKGDGFQFAENLIAESRRFKFLSEINHYTTTEISKFLDIQCTFTTDSSLKLVGDKNQKLIDVCHYFGINRYYSGPTALQYLESSYFEQKRISIEILNFFQLPRISLSKEPSILHWLATKSRQECIELTTFRGAI